jgi:hypothetical protein
MTDEEKYTRYCVAALSALTPDHLHRAFNPDMLVNQAHHIARLMVESDPYSRAAAAKAETKPTK